MTAVPVSAVRLQCDALWCQRSTLVQASTVDDARDFEGASWLADRWSFDGVGDYCADHRPTVAE